MNWAYRSPTERLRIIVLGYIVRCPLGGMAWHYLQYVMGLAQLGHDVYFVEDSDDYPCCYDPERHVTDTDPTFGLTFAHRSFDAARLSDRWAYHDAHSSQWFGPCAEKIVEVCAKADMVLNISGANPLRSWLMEIPVRVFIDTDPVFEQVRQLSVPKRRERTLQHTAHFSFGENICSPASRIPDDGLRWQATRQPIVLDAWPVTDGTTDGKFTTVMQWDSYPERVHNGVRYGLKSASFLPFLELPKKTGPILELALGSPSAPSDLLRRKGWVLRNPLDITESLQSYQQYIRQSKAEFSVAKQGFVVGNCGWFSERSACYLASGRPVVVQDTGFSRWLQADGGVVPFRTLNEAHAGIEEVSRRYKFHCAKARVVAEEYFDARRVLPRLIERAMNSTDAPTHGNPMR